ncbi:hypothetical protein [Candidatus Methanomassiliicoccus intestinalis]|uniref:hypothetical protein n=1 Tax=Candidatus Methanomassiliicoccus intestinalis TaxID=1406512 RepID=UPI0037DD9C96
MSHEEILTQVKEKLQAISGVMEVLIMDEKVRGEVFRLETIAESNGACGGLLECKNDGVWESLKRDVTIALVGDQHLLLSDEGLVMMMDDAGNIVGEYVTPLRKEQILRVNPQASFLSDDFVIYDGVQITSEVHFVINEVGFDYLKDVEGVKNVTSGSISTLSDDYLRELTKYTEKKYWTHLVGFDFA